MFLKNSGVCWTRGDLSLSYDHYQTNMCLFQFDLTRDHGASDQHVSLPEMGSIRLRITYEKPLKENIVILVIFHQDKKLLIDQHHNCTIEEV